MQLSKNFHLREFTKSITATRNDISNEPTNNHILNLKSLCVNVLQPLRDKIGKPIRISSGYRSPALNKFIGGSSRSQHCQGRAVDIEIMINGVECNEELWNILYNSSLIDYDQLINEFDLSWIHISYHDNGNRNEALEAYKDSEGKTRYRKLK